MNLLGEIMKTSVDRSNRPMENTIPQISAIPVFRLGALDYL